MAVRVSGFSRAGALDMRQDAAQGPTGTQPRAAVPHQGDPWFISWPDADGTFGYTFLVKLPADGGPLRLRVTLAPAGVAASSEDPQGAQHDG
jgi:hypothetical protein